MAVHARRRMEKRQDSATAPIPIPSSSGIIDGGVSSVAQPDSQATAVSSLAIDGGVTSSGPQTAPNLAPTISGPITITTNSPSTPTSSISTTPTSEPVVSSASSKSIALSTVIGSCVGAFIGASALIIFGLWMYRRYSKSLKKQARGPLRTRNINGDQQRRQSRLEPWNKLGDTDDKWEGMYQTKETREADHVAPMEKLTMFKKTPSVRTAYTHKSADVSTLDFPQSYAEFDPKLAETLSTGPTLASARPFMGREATNEPPASWNSDTASKSVFSVQTQMSSGAMSPALHMPKAHVWESAEVEDAGQANPDDNRRSTHNPFFSARDIEPRVRSRSNSRTRSRSNSVTKSPTAKGKERMRYSIDPFDDIHELPKPPQFIQHSATASTASVESKEKALQSLIAALEITEDEARSRLRVASMQPSFISNFSSIGPDDEDVTKEFPLPPSQGGSQHHHS